MGMKERKTTSALRRILANCSIQVKDYGSCIAQRVPEIEHDMCLKEFLALKACMNTVIKMSKEGKQSDLPGVVLSSNVAVSHVYIQQLPLQFDMPGCRGVYYDEGNKMIMSLALNQVFSWKLDPSTTSAHDPICDSVNEGPALSIRYSLDGKVIGIQRSSFEIEFRNRETGLTFTHRCRSESESILGFFWTECPSCDIVLVKTSGLDMFWCEPDLESLSLVETKRVNVCWYKHTYESRLLLLASGMQCKTFSGFQFSSGGIVRLPKFEMTMAKAEANAKPVLAEDDVHILTIYGRIYCAQVDRVAMIAYLYRFYRDAVVQQGSFPIYSSRIAVHVVDNVLLVHQIDAKVVILYDIYLNTQTPISAPLPLMLRSTSETSVSSSLPVKVNASGRSNEHILYDDGWMFLVPNLICDVVGKYLWKIHLDLEAIASSSSEVTWVLDFLQRRRSECWMAKQLCLAILRTAILERRPISMISKSLNVLISAYSQSVKAGCSPQTGSNSIHPESHVIAAIATSHTKSLSQQHPNPAVDDTRTMSAIPVIDERRITEHLTDGSTESSSSCAMEVRANSDNPGTLNHEIIGSSSFHRRSVDADSDNIIANVMEQHHVKDSCAAISPEDMYHFVFTAIEEEMSADTSYFMAVIIEYLRSSAREKVRVLPSLHVMTVQLLSRNQLHSELDMFVTCKIIEPSKEVAFQLLESGRQSGHVRKMGIDMLRLLALHHDYLSILFQDGYYLEALRYARKNKVETIQPSVYLHAAFKSDDPQQLGTVLRFLSDFIPNFRTTADYITYTQAMNEMGDM